MLTHLKISNVLGVKHLDTDLAALTVIAGGNARGKSSVLDALRMAIRGTFVRGVAYKQDVHALVADGAKTGKIDLTFTDGRAALAISNGKFELDIDLAEPYRSTLIPVLLDPDTFARAPVAERRRMVYQAVGVKPSSAWITERFQQEKISDVVTGQCLALVKDGWDTAHESAKKKISSLTGEWKGITGEAYGAVKAKNWQANVVAAEPFDFEAERAKLKKASAVLDQLIERVGVAKKAQEFAALPDEKTLEVLRGQVQAAEAQVESLRKKQAKAIEKAAAQGGVQVPCPCCNEMLVIDRGTLSKYDEAVATPEPQSRALIAHDIAAAERTLSDLKRDRDDLAAKRVAAAMFFADGMPADLDIETAQAAREEQAAHVNYLQGVLSLAERAHEAATRAQDVTARATAKQADIEAWNAALALLAPDGLQAELLAKAMKPFREALAAAPASWPAITLDDDMQIRVGGRLYGLCSESERWRADAACVVAIATKAGAPLLLLDRFDVLEPALRGDAIDWLADVAQCGVQVIVAGTFKSDPTENLPEGAACVWLANDSAREAQAV